MSIPVPIAGQPVLDTWGAAITNQHNMLIPLAMDTDFDTNSATEVDCDGLVFEVEAGKVYSGQLLAWSSVQHADSQCQWAFDHPGGDAHMTVRAATSAVNTEQNTRQSATNQSTTFDNAGAVDSVRHCFLSFRYVCSSDGEFAIRVSRSGTSGGITVHEGSGGLVTVSA